MHLVQFIFIALSVLFLFRTFVSFKAKRIALKTVLFWGILWFLIIFVAILPQTTVFFSKILGINRGTDAAVYFSIILIFFLIYKIGIRLEKIEHEITEITRHLTLNKDKKK
jgi:hypothetical protein